MEQDTLSVCAVIAVAAALFAGGRVRLDIVAMGVVVVFAVSGVMSSTAVRTIPLSRPW